MGLHIGAVLSIVPIDIGISVKLAQGGSGDDSRGYECIFHFTLYYKRLKKRETEARSFFNGLEPLKELGCLKRSAQPLRLSESESSHPFP